MNNKVLANVPVFPRKRPLLSESCMGNQEQIAAVVPLLRGEVCSHSGVCCGNTCRRSTSQLAWGSFLPHEGQDSDLQFNSRFFFKAGEGRGEKRKKSKGKSRLRCVLMIWTKLPNKNNFTNKNIFLLN